MTTTGAFLDNKTALVTGGGSGIGRATALAFSRAGASVVVADVSIEHATDVVHQIRAEAGSAIAISCDVRSRQQIETMIESTVKAFGSLDCAFNNVGVGGPILPLADYPDDSWHEVIETNLTSIFMCMKHEIRQMVKQGSGAIVNCASVSGLVGLRRMPAYSASKHGVIGLTKTAALDYVTSGLRINAVCPGTIHTPAVDSFLESQPEIARPVIDAMIAAEPIGRLGTPEEVADAVVWLCSPAASFVIGHAFAVDGGYLAQ